MLLNREGWNVGKYLVERLYREEGLSLRQRVKRRRRAAEHRRERFHSTAPNQVLSMDFVADQLADGRRFRSLTVMDIYTRECLAIEAAQSLKGEECREGNESDQDASRCFPKCCFVITEPSSPVRQWTCGPIRTVFAWRSRGQGSQQTIPLWSRSTGAFEQSVLDAHWFPTLTAAREIVETWRRGYNESRPHRALGERTPNEFASQIAAGRDLTGLQTAENSL